MKRLIEEGRKILQELTYPPWTVRQRKRGPHMKLPDGTWVRVKERRTGGGEAHSSVIKELGKIVDSGILEPGMSLADHVAEAQELRQKHAAGFDQAKKRLSAMAPEGARITGRVKTMESILGKIVRNPGKWEDWKYPRPGMITDATGIRIEVDDLEQVFETAKKVQENYEVVFDDDYVNNPRGDYRSYHFTVVDEDGMTKELQIRTPGQHDFAEWSHDVYKPQTPEQEVALEHGSGELDKYSADMSDFIFKADKGEDPVEPPPCPDVARNFFGCINPEKVRLRRRK